MQVITEIPDNIVQEVQDNVLAVRPIPLDDENQPLYTSKAWLEKLLLDFLKKLNKKGSNKRAAADNPPVDF